MDNFTSVIESASFEMTARDRIKYKDLTDAIKLDEQTQKDGTINAEISNYVIVNIHNPKSKSNPDYKNYMYIATDGSKFVSGSESLWRAFIDIYTELRNDGDNSPIALKFYRVPSKNYSGKDFLTCSLA